MKYLRLALVAIFSTFFAVTAQNENPYIKDAIPSTVSLIMEDDFEQTKLSGTGFLIGEGMVATSIHVVEGSKFGYALLADDETKHKIEGYYSIDKDNHLVILSVPTIKGEGIKLSYMDDLDIGKKIYAIGMKRGITGGVSRGIITGTRKFDERKLYQISAPISPASIGGPVLNDKGEAVGIALSALYQGTQINVAVPVEYLRKLKDVKVENISYLPIQKGTAKNYLPESEQKYILKGIEIFNKEYENNHVSKKNLRLGQNLLKRFSIRNDFPYKVMNVRINFVAVGQDGIPIDHYTKTFLEGYPDEVLEPNVTKAVELGAYDWEKSRALRLEEGETLEIRVIDFEFIEE